MTRILYYSHWINNVRRRSEGQQLWLLCKWRARILAVVTRYHKRLVMQNELYHYDDVTLSAMASQITSLTIVYSTVYSGADQSKHQSSASLAFVWGIHRGPVNSPHKWPVTRKMFPFDDVIMFVKAASLALVQSYGDCLSIVDVNWSIWLKSTNTQKTTNEVETRTVHKILWM